jgi:hypothetical protein
MSSVSCRKNQNLYVLALPSGHYWLYTLATNRAACYALAKPYCRNPANYKRELKAEGYRCVRVHVVEA